MKNNAQTPTTPIARGDLVTVEGGTIEYTVVAVHSFGKDVQVGSDISDRNGPWVAIDQVRKVR